EVLTLTFSNSATAVPTQIFPHIAADGYWQTDFLILNTSAAPVVFTLKFHPDSGSTIPLNQNGTVSQVAQISATIQPHGTAFYTTGATSTSSGWAELDSPTPLDGVAVFRSPAAQTSVPLASPVMTFTAPFDSTAQSGGLAATYINGLAIANADPLRAAKITCTVYTVNGTALARNLSIPEIPPS